jgi:DNA-binding response OmpR family regulator
MLLTRELEHSDYRVIDVGDGIEALDVLGREPVDVLITDVMMPNLDGISLLERARELQPGIRSIVMTGDSTPNAVVAAFRNQACDLLLKPFSLDDLRTAVECALSNTIPLNIEVISSKPHWIELSVPCDLSAVERIQKLLMEVEINLPRETREAVGSVFREMLNNAIEHGGKLDPTNRVEVKYIRLKRAILYSIKDPGEGFDLENVEHAAVSNPEDEPYRHMEVRKQKGLRPGGYGILLASQVIDELIYNEKHNELIFVKYLDDQQQTS